MAVKEIKPKKISNLFPRIASEQVFTLLHPPMGAREEDPEEFLGRVKKRRLLDLERRSIEKELKDELDKDENKTQKTEPKRQFSIINNQIIREDDGEYSLNEAVKILSAQRNSQESSLVELARAMKELRPGETMDVPKMISDIKALVPVPEVTRGEVELMMQNQAMETRHAVERSIDDLKSLIVRTDNKNPVEQVMNVWQSLPDSLRNRLESVVLPSPGAMYKDGQGNVASLPDWIQLKRLEIEIEEKSEAGKFKRELIKTAQIYAPDVLATLRSFRGEKSKGEEALEQTDWGKREQQGESREALTKQIVKQFHLVKISCVSCGKKMVCTENTCSIACPHCGAVITHREVIVPQTEAKEEQPWQEHPSAIESSKPSRQGKGKSSKTVSNGVLAPT